MKSIPEDVYALGLELEGLEQAERTAQGQRAVDVFGVCLQGICFIGFVVASLVFGLHWIAGAIIMAGSLSVGLRRLNGSMQGLDDARAETETARMKFNEAVVQNTPLAS